MNSPFSIQDFVVVTPILSLFLISWIPLFLKVFNGNREPNPFATLIYSLVGLIVAVGLTAVMSGSKYYAFSKAIVIDGLTVWASYLVYLSAAATLMMAYDHVAIRGKQFSEFCFLVLSASIGMIILMMANDLIIVFLGIEMLSLCLYILVAMSREEVLAKEAAFKYFILGSFASALFLLGVAYLYGAAGSTYLQDIQAILPSTINTSPLVMLALGLLLCGFAFKASIFPFHSWTPDVYQGAASPVTAFMATGAKAAVFVALIRLFDMDGFVGAHSFLGALCWLSALTMTVGNVGAMMQTNLKRLIAYSSIANSGYIFMGLIAAGFGNNFGAGAVSVLFYLFNYTIVTLGAFAVIGVLERRAEQQLTLDDLKGLASRHPALAAAMAVLLISMAGVPPTLGFFGKFTLFTAVVEQDLYWLAFWGVFNSVIAVYYYLRPIVYMFMQEGEGVEPLEESQMSRATIMIAALTVLLIGLFSSPLIKTVQKTVLSLF